MATGKYKVFFESGSTSPMTYSNGDRVSLIEITNTDQDYYQSGRITLYNAPSTQSIGDTCMVLINDVLQFNGYISKRDRLSKGVIEDTYHLVGKTYDLWRDHTDEGITYSNKTTCYIASSLVGTYCDSVGVSDTINLTSGTTITGDITFDNEIIGDALIRLTELDGYRFYVDVNGELQYEPYANSDASINISEDNIVDMQPLEEDDSDIVNDCLVIGGSGYSQTTTQDSKPSSEAFPGDLCLVAQRFKTKDDRLSAVKMYLNRTIDPYQPTDLLFEIWENTERVVWEDHFTDYDYLIQSSDGLANSDLCYNMEVSDTYLHLARISSCSLSTTSNAPWYYTPTKTGRVALGHVSHINSGCLFRFSIDPQGVDYTNCTYYICPTSNTGVPDYDNAYGSGTCDINNDFSYVYPKEFPIPSGQMVCVILGRNWDWSQDFSLKPPSITATPPTCEYGKKLSYWKGGTGTSDWTSYVDGTDAIFKAKFEIANFQITGQIISNEQTKSTQYMKLDWDGMVSSNWIFISGTNNSFASSLGLLVDNNWYDFDYEWSGQVQVKYKFSGNGKWTPRLDYAQLSIADDTGGFESEMCVDTFTGETYISSETASNMQVEDGYLTMSGSNSGWKYFDWADRGSYNSCGLGEGSSYCCDGYWCDSGNISSADYGNKVSQNTWTCNTVFGWNPDVSQKYVSKLKANLKVTGYYNSENHPTYAYIDRVQVSGTKFGWTTAYSTAEEQGGHTVTTQECEFNYVYSGVRKVKVRTKYSCRNRYGIGFFGYCQIYVEPSTQSMNFGVVSSQLFTDGSEYNYITIEPTDVTYKDFIGYSGSLDGGSNWDSITPNSPSQISNPGTQMMVSYWMKKSGSGFGASSSVMVPGRPKIGGVTIYGQIYGGGGYPASGTKVEHSDDISFNYNEIPYPPSYSSWQTYTDPKLKLTEDTYYWMIFDHASGNSEYWSYYYDPTLTTDDFDGKIAISWDDGINWSSATECPELVPKGSMAFKLGWKDASVTATSSNQTSIDTYGRHFKKVTDTNITTYEEALARASTEVADGTAPKKGSITIDGNEYMGLDYRLSSNLDYFGINEFMDVIAYTQTIDNRGFTTTIQYGKSQFDLARKVAELERELT